MLASIAEKTGLVKEDFGKKIGRSLQEVFLKVGDEGPDREVLMRLKKDNEVKNNRYGVVFFKAERMGRKKASIDILRS